MLRIKHQLNILLDCVLNFGRAEKQEAQSIYLISYKYILSSQVSELFWREKKKFLHSSGVRVVGLNLGISFLVSDIFSRMVRQCGLQENIPAQTATIVSQQIM